MKHPNFLVDHKNVSSLDILHFLIYKMHMIRGSTSRGQLKFVSCLDSKQAKIKK